MRVVDYALYLSVGTKLNLELNNTFGKGGSLTYIRTCNNVICCLLRCISFYEIDSRK